MYFEKMSYCISYSPKYHDLNRWYQVEKYKTPYEDWCFKNTLPAIFKYCEHCNDDILKIYLNPFDQILYINGNLDYYTYWFVCKLRIDHHDKTIKIEKLFCKNINHWPEINGKLAPKTGGGGMSCYKSNIKLLGDDFSIDYAVEKFFGNTWKVIIPLTVPKISEETFEIVKKYKEHFDFYRCGPWGKTIGLYMIDQLEAAIIIQKYYRGWKARMTYAYNPNTTLGKYYMLKSFKSMFI